MAWFAQEVAPLAALQVSVKLKRALRVHEKRGFPMPKLTVDVHGHIVAPAELYAYREFLIGARGHYGRRLKGFSDAREGMAHGRNGVIAPEELKHFAEEHISWLDKVGTDVQLVSARPYSLMHSEKPHRIVHWWAMAVNDAIATQSEFYPKRIQGIANLPQCWGEPIETTFEELDRCINELGFVGALVNPDPSEGRAPTEVPGLGDEYWYPLYEKLVHYGAPMFVHSCGCISERENQSVHFITRRASPSCRSSSPKCSRPFPTSRWSSPTAVGRSHISSAATGALLGGDGQDDELRRSSAPDLLRLGSLHRRRSASAGKGDRGRSDRPRDRATR